MNSPIELSWVTFRANNETNPREDITITEKAPTSTGAFSLLGSYIFESINTVSRLEIETPTQCPNSVLNVKALMGTFNQEKVCEIFSNHRFPALLDTGLDSSEPDGDNQEEFLAGD